MGYKLRESYTAFRFLSYLAPELRFYTQEVLYIFPRARS